LKTSPPIKKTSGHANPRRVGSKVGRSATGAACRTTSSRRSTTGTSRRSARMSGELVAPPPLRGKNRPLCWVSRGRRFWRPASPWHGDDTRAVGAARDRRDRPLGQPAPVPAGTTEGPRRLGPPAPEGGREPGRPLICALVRRRPDQGRFLTNADLARACRRNSASIDKQKRLASSTSELTALRSGAAPRWSSGNHPRA
jgi:hypothetical protein